MLRVSSIRSKISRFGSTTSKGRRLDIGLDPFLPWSDKGLNFGLEKANSWDLYSGVRRRRVSPVGLSSHDSSGARNLIFLKYLVAVMSHSIYKNQCHQLRVLFDQAASPKQVLCVPIDYAKSKHVALICDGNGHVLKQSLTVHNNRDGVAFLLEQVDATARRRKIPKSQIFFGGEDLPSYAENFVHQLSEHGYLITRVNAKQAKDNRESEIASNDNLALLGIAKTLLSRRARVVADPSETSDPDIYRSISDLSRARNRWVKSSTAVANQIHTHVDRLFPGFLDPAQSGLTPFTHASQELMKSSRFSSTQFSRRKPATLAKRLKTLRIKHPDETARQIIELAQSALAPDPRYIASQQQTLQAAVDLYRCNQRVAGELKQESAILLAATPYAFVTTLPGISLTIASGCAGELGKPDKLGRVDHLCSYSGIVPRTYQTGGPDIPAQTGKTPQRCNHYLKYWVTMASMKMARWGDAQWKARQSKWDSNGQHSLFAGSKRYLRLVKALVTQQIAYQSHPARQAHSSKEVRALDAEQTWAQLVRKWSVIPNYQEIVFDEAKPLGFWRRLMIEMFDAHIPIPPK